MPSDAYMEISDPAVWGETHDEYFGEQGRNLGAFEIFGFEFGAHSTREDADSAGPNSPGTTASNRGSNGPHGNYQQSSSGGSVQGAAVHTQPVVKQFTIKKFIDKGSPDLLLACCKAGLPDAKKIDWAIISIRETGETNNKPYLVIEFQGLWVDAFNWSISPGGDAASASQEETVTFSFETILIKYCRQQETGQHTRVKIKGFNRVNPDQDVPELVGHTGLAVEDN